MTYKKVDAATLRTWLGTKDPGESPELAVLDIRSEADFAKGQPLFATNLPYQRFSAELNNFVPRKSVRIVLVDSKDDGTAVEAAAYLDDHGYSDVNVLSGGVAAWTKLVPDSTVTFDIPGIVFSERVRDARKTPSITAAEVHELQNLGADLVVIDTRTIEEFEKGHVTGARVLPGAELLYRLGELVSSPNTFIVTSCAGLPRAILGAQTLIDAGVPNRIAYLDDGTKAWRDAGYELETGLHQQFKPVSGSILSQAQAYTAELEARAPIGRVSHAELQRWLADDTRTTYVLDVRLAQDFAAKHLDGSVSAPGGQLLAVSHRTVAIRGARLVLVDDVEVRAVTTAYWLKQRGWEVHILAHPFSKLPGARSSRKIAEAVS